MKHLAFDLGAGSGKLFCGSLQKEKLALFPVHSFPNAPVPLGAGLYWDFLSIWQNLVQGMQAATAQWGDIATVGLDSFSNDFSLIDADGELLCPMRCYRDARTTRNEEAIYRNMGRRQLYFASGNQIAPFGTLMQLAAMRAEGKDAVLNAAHRLLLLPDLATYYMTGEEQAEYTIASVSQMYDFAAGGWSDTILDAFDIPRRLLPPIVAPGSRRLPLAGTFRRQHALPALDVVPVCAHDTASAFLALPVAGPAAILSSGTWSILGCEAEGPVINDYGFAHNIANEGGCGQGHHRLLRNVMGSWLLQQLRAQLALEGTQLDFARLATLAAEAPAFAWLVDVDHPDFFAPGEVKQKILRHGLFPGGTPPQSPGQFARCISESLALRYRWALRRLEVLCGAALPVVVVLGGGAKDAFLCQLTANACARPVLAGPTDATAIGNIAVQMIACGQLGSIEEARQLVAASFPPAEYLPQDTAPWQQAYARYCEALGLEE